MKIRTNRVFSNPARDPVLSLTGRAFNIILAIETVYHIFAHAVLIVITTNIGLIILKINFIKLILRQHRTEKRVQKVAPSGKI